MTIIIICLVIFADVTIKVEKVGPKFSSFNLFPPLPSAAAIVRKLLKGLNIVLNNKTGSLLFYYYWKSFDAKTSQFIFFFKKRANSVYRPL